MDNTATDPHMQNELEIAVATLGDINQIMWLEKTGFDDGIREHQEVFEQRIRSFATGFLLLRLAATGTAIGYISSELWPFFDEVSPEMFALNHSVTTYDITAGAELYISSMTVAPEFRGHGLGQFLLDECLKRTQCSFPQIQSAILAVSEDWDHARSIYEQRGFLEVYRLPDFFRPIGQSPQTAIIMRLLLARENPGITPR